MSTRENILKALNWRYATKVFDPKKKVSTEDLDTILESARLAPSSTGLEPWKFLVIENPELRKKLRGASFDQTKVTDASHLIVLAHRTDTASADELIERTATIQKKEKSELAGLKQMADMAVTRRNAEQLDAWSSAQTYIPLGMMVETAALLGIDTCAMEGFKSDEVNAILDLPAKNLKVSTMLAIGYRGDDPAAKRAKVRRSKEEVIETIK